MGIFLVKGSPTDIATRWNVIEYEVQIINHKRFFRRTDHMKGRREIAKFLRKKKKAQQK